MTPAPALTSVQNRRRDRKKAQSATAATRVTSANSPLLATKSILPSSPDPFAQCTALMYTSSRTEYARGAPTPSTVATTNTQLTLGTRRDLLSRGGEIAISVESVSMDSTL